MTIEPANLRDSEPVSADFETVLTPLHFAVINLNIKMTKILLGHGANPNALSDDHSTLLHLLLCSDLFVDDTRVYYIEKDPQKRRKVLSALIEDPRTSLTVKDYEGRSPLHCIEYNWPKSATEVQTLLAYGADPNGCNLRQKTPLYLAIQAGHYASVKLLIESGVNVGLTDDSGLDALHYAAQSGDYETIAATLELKETESMKLVVSRDTTGKNVLHHLFIQESLSRVSVLRFLLNRGADSLAVNDSECIPLATCFRDGYYTDPEICELLLKVEGNATFSNRKGQNLGHLCVQNSTPDIFTLRFLHENGVDLIKKDHEGKTILHVAAMQGSLE